MKFWKIVVMSLALSAGWGACERQAAHAYGCTIVMLAPRTPSEEIATHGYNKVYQPDGHVHWYWGPFKIGESRFYDTTIYKPKDTQTPIHDCVYFAPWWTR